MQNDQRAPLEKQGGVAFVFDRVMHYHVPVLCEIESRLAEKQIPLALFSASPRRGETGRVAEEADVTRIHRRYRLHEWQVGSYTVRYQSGLARLLEEARPLVVVSMCHSGTITEWKMLSQVRRWGGRAVAWQCGFEYNPGLLKRFILSHFVPRFDCHLCYHSNAKRYAIEHGAREVDTVVMHNTLDERRIVPKSRSTAKDELAAQFPKLARKKVVLYVGAVLAEKRLELVFDAMDLLSDPSLMFVVVGDGPHLPILKRRFGRRDDWFSVGRVVDGVGLFFDAADVFVLPGTGGLAINEAMAHRLPVISAYADGSADDLVMDGETGYRLRSDTADELAGLLGALVRDEELRTHMGERGEQFVRNQYSFLSFVSKVVDALVEQHGRAPQTRLPA